MPNHRLEKILELYKEDPGNSFLLYAIALEYQAESDFDRSIEFFERLRSLDPEYLGLYYPLAGLYHQVEKKDLALIRVQEGIQIAIKQNNFKTKAELETLSRSFQDFED